MRNIWLLLKVYFKSFIGNFIKNSKSPKFIVAVIVSVLFSLLLVVVFGFNTYTLINQYKQVVIPEHPDIDYKGMIMFVNCATALMLFFLLVVMRATFSKRSKDYDMLYAMPIRKGSIVTAKLIYNYLFDCFGYFLVFMPSIVVFAFMIEGAGWQVIIRGLTLSLALPLLSNALASLLALVFERFARLFKFYSVVQAILCITLASFYIVFSFNLNGFLEGKQPNEAIYQIFIFRWIIRFMLNGHMLSFLYILLICLVPMIVAVFVAIKTFTHVHEQRRSFNKPLTYKKRAPLWSLYEKEIKFYFSSSVYLMNTIFGAIIYVGIAIMFNTKIKEYLDVYLESFIKVTNFDTKVILIMLLTTIIGTVVTTGSSISLEGNRFWIIKVHPFNTLDIFKAKILTNLTITIVPIIIGSVAVMFTYGPLFGLLTFALSFLASIICSILGLLINLTFPKMEWQTEEEVIKRSLAPTISLFCGSVVAIIPFIGYFIINTVYPLNIYYLALICASAYCLLIVALWYVLHRRGVKLFNNIS